MGGWGGPRDMILPSIALGLAPAAYVARLIRLGLADIMTSDYIRTARAKGLSHRDALFKHALKVAFLPVLSFLGPAAASVMTGSFVVETIFNIPGIGQEFVYAVQNKDQMVILGVVLVFATMLITFNLLVDLAYAWVDPRIELG
jgi:oligopeptide transport system permease protein